MEIYQEKRGLSLEMLNQIEVCEIVSGISSSSEILEIHQWITEMYKIDQQTFGSRVISKDVEDVKTTFYDTLRYWRYPVGVLCSGLRWSLKQSTGLERTAGDRYLVRS